MDDVSAAKTLIASLDLTSLNDDDTDETIGELCAKALTPAGKTAAVCVYPRFIPTARADLPADIKIATVINFPAGLAAMTYIFINLAQEPKNYDSLSSGEAAILAGILIASALSLIPAQKAVNFNNARLNNGELKFSPIRWYEVLFILIGLSLMLTYFWANQFLYN